MDRPHDLTPDGAGDRRDSRRSRERGGGQDPGTAARPNEAVNPTPERFRTISEARQARDRALQLEARARFLAEASKVLASSLDFRTTLRSVARLAVPTLGDWCIVDVLDEDGRERPVAVAAPDGADASLVHRLECTAPASNDTPCAVASRTSGEATAATRGSLEAVLSEWLPEPDTYPDRRTLLQALGVRAEICVPLVARERTLGALTLLATTSDRTFQPDDLKLAEELAQRAAVAVDNALLYREAERANTAKAQFLATMSHEFRTPLQTVMGFTDLLLLGKPVALPDAARTYAERISAASAHLLQLIDQVLDFARLDAGRETLHIAPVDIGVFAREMVLLVEPLAAAKGLSFAVQCSTAGETVVTDAGKLRQICYNLLANAIKFTERGEVMLAACIDDGHLVMEVRDTGVGITPAELRRIFEPFYQVAGPGNGVRRGTGLGLSISRDLVKLLGGNLRVVSEAGVGTTFTLILPLVRLPFAGRDS